MMILANVEGCVGVDPAREALSQRLTALDAVEQGIRAVEADPTVRTVGFGGAPNLLGEVECDAAIMDGHTMQAGAVGALKGYMHAVSAARQVMERLPHTFLVGEGAARFCKEIGAEETEMLSDEAASQHERWLERHVPAEKRQEWPPDALSDYAWISGRGHVDRGTTLFLVIDEQGNLAAGTSTSGWARKYPGRIGDTPIIGAGLFVDNRYGACACTHIGEMALRAATSHSVISYMKHGASVEDACREAGRDLERLQGGLLGPVVIHAIDARGTPFVLATKKVPENIIYYHWRSGEHNVESERPVIADR